MQGTPARVWPSPFDVTHQLPVAAPPWPYCRHGSDSTDTLVGCRGRRVDPHDACLEHLADSQRAFYLAQLGPGSDLDHRGSSITESLLGALLDAVRDPDTQLAILGTARFDEARFLGDAGFNGVRFGNEVGFEQAIFLGTARFVGSEFRGDASFERARLCGAQFRGAVFQRSVWFGEASFTDDFDLMAHAFRGTSDSDALSSVTLRSTGCSSREASTLRVPDSLVVPGLTGRGSRARRDWGPWCAKRQWICQL